MAPQNLKQRPPKDDPSPTTTTTTRNNNNNNKSNKKLAMARGGLRSLAIAIAVPFSLTILTIFAFGSTPAHGGLTRPFPFLPLWVIHLASLSSSCLMGLSGWLMWAEGGFHRQPTALPLYVAQFVLGLLWAPVVFAWGATRLGLLVCAMLFAALYGCSQCFREVNPIAGDLMKPTLAWVGFLGLMNYKLV